MFTGSWGGAYNKYGIMEEIFKFRNLTYNFSNAETFNRSNVNFVKYGTETITP